MSKNKSIRQTLLFLFDDGINEVEAHKEINKLYGQKSISRTTVYKWFKRFKSGDRDLNDRCLASSRNKFTDEYLIELINSNPDLDMKELAKLADTTPYTISKRIKQINNGGQRVIYIKNSQRGKKYFTDEFLINLINDNAGLSRVELAKLANVCVGTIYNRLKQINNNREDNDKIVIQKNLSKIKPRSRKFSDEFLINLINDNPGLNMTELSQLADTSFQNISKRLQLINNNRAEDDKIILQNNSNKRAVKKDNLTDESLIKLINENPDLNMTELARIADTTQSAIFRRVKAININNRNNDGKSNLVMYTNKSPGRPKKFTDEFLINLINKNPNISKGELAKLTNITTVGISHRINKINKDRAGEGKINLQLNWSKTRGKPKKFSDEFLINLVNQNPSLNIKELAKLADASSDTISKRIRKINSEGERANYIKK